ncbi:hypothetical protein SteCoe_20108 [Stentor coeruleus]|uniref:Casein kinase I n=1 Tax=Stentor coeruleus TaxID=5963 RepID=A0A1R2BSS5_9CILI|nr:hypothetical protein SteCoe_20108 [Stentor coeruleus]
MIDIRVGWRYRLGRKLGTGAFGDIFHGLNIQTNEEVAIKLEKSNKKNSQLQYESRILKSLQGSQGVPHLYWFGTEGSYNAMIIDLLGPTLEELFQFTNQKFSLKTVLMIIDQLLTRIETLHSKNFIHRDIKPENFLIGLGKKSNIIHIIDFGLAKQYRDPKTHKHIPFVESKSLIGTSRYASVNNHLGYELGRRDDLESLCYSIIYFLNGCLPWQGKNYLNKDEKEKITKDLKLNMNIHQICGDMPSEFSNLLSYSRALKFDERPDYPYLKKIFKDLFIRSNFEYDSIYDWTILNYVKPINLENFYRERRSIICVEESKDEISAAGTSEKRVSEAKSDKKCSIF